MTIIAVKYTTRARIVQRVEDTCESLRLVAQAVALTVESAGVEHPRANFTGDGAEERFFVGSRLQGVRSTKRTPRPRVSTTSFQTAPCKVAIGAAAHRVVGLVLFTAHTTTAFRYQAECDDPLLGALLPQKHEFRNVAIIAHVDHGKTTLVDAMLEQSLSLIHI